MECAGERYMPAYDGDWTLEHIHRYLLARELAEGKDVLDIASGEGYGSHMLTAVARRVIGVDIDAEAVRWAQEKYQAGNLEYLKGSAIRIPISNNSVDLVTSFETIEHLAEHDAMLAEIKRVLRPGGLLIISSPDKHEYTDLPEYHNAYHVKELYRHEFEALLGTHFMNYCIYGQRVVFGSVIGAEQNSSFISWDKDAYDSGSVGLSRAEYLVAVAGDIPLPVLPSGILRRPLCESDMVRQLRGRTKEMEDAISYLERAWHEEQEKRRQAQDEAARAMRELSSMYGSRSWKITSPLRKAAEFMRRVRSGTTMGGSVAAAQKKASPSPVWPPDVCALRLETSFSDTRPVAKTPSIGVFVHMYYPELTDAVAVCLRNVPFTSLHVSTDTKEKAIVLRERFTKHGIEPEIRLCPNMGWDIAPFLVGYGNIIPHYDLLLRLHSKRSPQIPGAVGEAWRTMLYSSLAGSPGRVNAILRAFESHPDLGMVSPPLVAHYAQDVHFGGNFAQMSDLLKKYGVQVTPETPIDFPMGSMFWCRPQVLLPWLTQGFSYDDFAPLEADIRDSSLAHAIERLFFFGCGIVGKRWARLPDETSAPSQT